MTLDHKIAFVTGSTRGIGKAIAEALQAEGATVISSGRTGGAIPCDVRDFSQVQSAMQQIEKDYGRLDILVNNAGIGRFGILGELAPQDWREVIDTNLNGVFHCCHAALPLLKKRGGWIVNISSLAGRNPFRAGIAYNASKFGLFGFTEALLQDLRYDDIRVVHIAPGSVQTDFGGSGVTKDGSWKLLPEDVARVVVDTLRHDSRSLPSYIEIRPSKPPKKS